jgi:hypothetical protein
MPGDRQVTNEAEQRAQAQVGRASVVSFFLVGDVGGWLVSEQVA